MNCLQEKNIRLQYYDYSSAGYYYVTICAKDRRYIFGRVVGTSVPARPRNGQDASLYVEFSKIGQYVDSAIKYYNANGSVLFDKYVIMPNHVHMIIVLKERADERGRSSLQNIIRNLKSYVTKQIGYSPWQVRFYDHVIGDEADYLEIWQYIDNNPAKWAEDEYYTEWRLQIESEMADQA